MTIVDSLLNFNFFLSGEVRRTSLFSRQAQDVVTVAGSSWEQSLEPS
jgi:hypothetical protein